MFLINLCNWNVERALLLTGTTGDKDLRLAIFYANWEFLPDLIKSSLLRLEEMFKSIHFRLFGSYMSSEDMAFVPASNVINRVRL